ncbi:MAG: hypothetical protein HOY76_31340 [Streptomyces sp.]|nr:hypothetical protein [Streptomyces sp.]NUS15204.1 hypothetical protein [Streptomyces sp.]
MRRFYKAAAVAAMLGSIGFIGMGTASASDRDISVSQNTKCVSHDLNLDVLGEVGILNGLAGNLANGEGDPGGQATHLGSTAGCNEDAF